ncbi:MAG TPA: spore germination protein GerW family protein [Candidatus Marinimicrobia bacterium]|jgi:sporulation protein YtfJ|nr:sporulation protein [Candidatus Neomarinimicrobiota bacterium]MDP6276829.1 spore germination protein GerW family protein [Candidatus Neomarinimicrobiota bacterium]MDP7217394.1 spore germination protein GerW family protein [Candidatus Neomarinimicrobiota bacterium]MDP7437376.1 spore germination protein GerW family protein [Candidatus Neomarinimicrobiota bacterium]HJL74563.1 spore germination protein GerW family protein [Candidatus Neomarinimicrobiota bacterium]|tara:strand:+ start:5228 stop:5614 length:387 start_codon:yes stop_codon:yes gene_type:complete
MSVTDLIKSTLEEVQNLMLTRTVVGEPITAGEHTVIPVSKVTFGFGAGGGASNESKQSGESSGIGGGWSIEPVAFVVLGADGAKMLTVGDKESVAGKLFDLAPKVMDTVKEMVDNKSGNGKSDGEESS